MVIFRFYWVKVNETLKLKNLKKIKQTTSFDVPGDINNINNNIMIINNINNVNINNINNITNINNIDINNINNFNNINNIKNLINNSCGKDKGNHYRVGRGFVCDKIHVILHKALIFPASRTFVSDEQMDGS